MFYTNTCSLVKPGPSRLRSVGIDQRTLGRSAHSALVSVLGWSSSRNQAGACDQRCRCPTARPVHLPLLSEQLSPRHPPGHGENGQAMRARALLALPLILAAAAIAPRSSAADAGVAALQVGLRSHGLYQGPIDGLTGPGTAK